MPTLSELLQNYAPLAGTTIAGLLQRSAAGSATNALTQGAQQGMAAISGGANQAAGTLQDLYNQQLGFLNPYATAGQTGLNALQQGLAPGGEYNTPFNQQSYNLYADPSYQFRLAEGQKAIDAASRAGGTRFSGATLKALNDYAQNYASQEYQNAFNRYQQDVSGRYGREMGLAGIGQAAAGQQAGAAQGYGTNLANLQVGTSRAISDLLTERASAVAAGDIAKANADTGMIQGILKQLSDQGILSQIFPQGIAQAGQLAPNIPTNTPYGPAAPAGGLGDVATAAGGAVPGIISSGLGAGAIGLGSLGEAAGIPLAGIGLAPETSAALGIGAASPALTAAPIAGEVAGGTAAGSAGGITGALGLGGGSGLFGLGAATIPVIGGALVGGYLLAKGLISEDHKTADKLTGEGGAQRVFEQNLTKIDQDPNLTPEQAWGAKLTLYNQLKFDAFKFAQANGQTGVEVARQMLDTISPLFGDNNPMNGWYSPWLGGYSDKAYYQTIRNMSDTQLAQNLGLNPVNG